MSAWTPGVHLGPYELLAPIGAGGMGQVWKARDTRLGRTVAIKRINIEHSARFEQEARAIAALSHPNICTLHDVGPDYLVMEHVEGHPVRGPLAPPEAVRVALQIAAALEEAHARKILHRDLKPGNILITEKGVAKLLDFGLAKLTGEEELDATKTIEGTVLGTAAYMAPEQAQGKPADARSDIFSFGAVLYEMLSGTRVFGGNSTAEVLSAVLRDDPGPLKAPPALENVVRKCLAKHPAQRFQSATELKNALEGIDLRAVEQPSIAVLPFADMSPGKDNEYFSDGLAEEIINALVQVPGLKVIARTSAFAFKGQNSDIRKIAEVLGVSTVLEGSVRKAGNRIRVTAQLITAADGTHLWSERYDRELADVFEVQDEIAAAIAGALKLKLSVDAAPRRYTPKLPAYEAYLKARHHRGRLTPEAIGLYKEYVEQAIELDPGFVLAYVDVADSHLMRTTLTWTEMPLVREYARKALELDPSLPEAQAMMGIVSGVYDYDWKEAERRFSLAMAHQPVPAQVRQWYGFFYLLPIGRYTESADELRRGLLEDPLNTLSRMSMAASLVAAGRPDDAVHEMRECIRLDPDLFFAYFNLSLAETAKGAFREAAASAEKMLEFSRWPIGIGLCAGLLAKTGDTKRSQALLEGLGDGSGYGAPLGLALFHLLTGDIDLAAEWVRKGIEQRHPLLLGYVVSTPMAAPLRTSAHWPALAKMMNLPETL